MDSLICIVERKKEANKYGEGINPLTIYSILLISQLNRPTNFHIKSYDGSCDVSSLSSALL